jgi:hypothetical protein
LSPASSPPWERAPTPQAYGELVSELCFPDILRYEVGTPAVFGFAKHNGRALADNAPEVMFSIVVNAALADGLNRNTATGTLRPDFPYVALPISAGVSGHSQGKDVVSRENR